MPVKHDAISSKGNGLEDFIETAGPLLPVGCVALSYFLMSQQKGDSLEYWKKLKQPSWLITNPLVFAPIEVACMAPVGYAAQIIAREAAGSDRRCALGLYTASLLAYMGAFIPIYTGNKNMKCWVGASALLTGILGATAASFHKINTNAGLMVAPMTLWMLYYTLGMYATVEGDTKE